MNYWIITASKDHVKKGMEGGFAQACHGKGAPLKRMKKGDFVIYYSSKVFMDQKEKCQEFTAIGQVKDEQVYEHQVTKDFCPSRIDINFLPCKDISILPLISSLRFIKDKKHWGYPFRWGILQIDQQDFALISDKMLSASSILQ